MSITACSGLQIRDNAKEKYAILDAAYMMAVMDILAARSEWRRKCNELRNRFYEVNSKDLDTPEAVLQAIKDHNAVLPQIETINAFIDEDGSIVSRVNKIQCMADNAE